MVQWERAEILRMGRFHLQANILRIVSRDDAEAVVEESRGVEVVGQSECLVQFLHILEAVERVDPQPELALPEHIPPLLEIFYAVWADGKIARFSSAETLVGQADDF